MEELKVIESNHIPIRLKRNENIYFLTRLEEKVQSLTIILTNYRLFLVPYSYEYDLNVVGRLINLKQPTGVKKGIKAYSLQSIIAVDQPEFQKKVYDKGYWYFYIHFGNGSSTKVGGWCKKTDLFILNSFLIELIDRINDPIDESVFKPKRENISEETKISVWRRDNGRCAKCGSRINLEYDHIIPVSKGGANTIRNIELLCEKCNRKKSNQIV